MKRALAAAIGCALFASPAGAQQIASSFDDLQGRIRLGETLFVTDTRGTTIEGKLLTLATSSLEIRIGRNEAAPPLRLTQPDVNNIYVVRHDRLWNGPLIGFAVGAGTAAVIEAAVSGGSAKFQGGSVIGLGSLCALVGLTFDLFNKEKLTVYVHAPAARSMVAGLRARIHGPSWSLGDRR